MIIVNGEKGKRTVAKKNENECKRIWLRHVKSCKMCCWLLRNKLLLSKVIYNVVFDTNLLRNGNQLEGQISLEWVVRKGFLKLLICE